MIDWLRREPRNPVVELGGRWLPISVRRHPRAKRMTLRLAPDGSEVRVSIPRWARSTEALDFAASRRVWLTAQLAKVPQPEPVAPGSSFAFRGAEIEICWHPDAPRRPMLDGARLLVGGPQDNLGRRVSRWLEGEALQLMQADLAEYCTRAEVAAPVLRLSRAQRRWGSCSSSGTLRINWRLVQAPDTVRRSVVAHEVAHLVHFDHSPAFYALLGDLFEGDQSFADAWLRSHGRNLYARFG